MSRFADRQAQARTRSIEDALRSTIMSLPTGGRTARETCRGALTTNRLATALTITCATALAATPASAQPFFGAYDNGFTAFADNGTALASPDIAVSPDRIVAVVSGELAWYTKNNIQQGSIALAGTGGLWDWIESPSDLMDAQVIWNASAQRFYVAAIGDQPNGSTRFNLAVSNTSDPADGWTIRNDPSGKISRLSIGVYEDGIYAVYDYATGEGSWYFRATESELLDPDRHHFIGGQLSEYNRAFSANDSSGIGDDRMIVSSAEQGTINKLRLVGKNPEWSGGPRITSWISIPWQSAPPMIEQAGAAPFDIGGMDFRSAKVVNDACWLAQTVASGDHAIVRWYEIDLNGWPNSGQAPALKQTGDIDLGPGVHTFLPDIAVDSQGNAAIVFSISSANQNVSVARAVRFHDDPIGEFRPHRIFLNSADAITNGVWGAYVGIEADPSQAGVFWSHTPYHENTWKTWISKVTLADDTPPSDGPRLYAPDNGFINNVIPVLQWDFNELSSGFRIYVSGDPRFEDDNTYESDVIQDTSFEIPEDVINCNERLYWRVVAITDHGEMMSDPDSRWFEKRLREDLNSDGVIDSADIGMFIKVYGTSFEEADFNGDGIVNAADLGSLIGNFGQICD